MNSVFILILINTVVYIIPYIINFGGVDSSLTFKMLGWKNNSDIDDGEWYRMLTASFLHADFLHLLFNMYALFDLGSWLLRSQVISTSQFLLIYFLSAIGGNLASYLFNPHANSVGASGAVFGLIGTILAVGLFYGQTSILVNMLVVIGLNVVYAMNSQNNIDNWGHMGGLVTGFLVASIIMIGRKYLDLNF